MKREDLKAIEGLTEEQINAVMRLHGLDAAAHQATVQGLQAQLATAQQGLAAFDGVDVNDLRSQITNLTNQLSLQWRAARCGPRGRCSGRERCYRIAAGQSYTAREQESGRGCQAGIR